MGEVANSKSWDFVSGVPLPERKETDAALRIGTSVIGATRVDVLTFYLFPLYKKE
jgi:hypothetical protein